MPYQEDESNFMEWFSLLGMHFRFIGHIKQSFLHHTRAGLDRIASGLISADHTKAANLQNLKLKDL